jgi:hypothetical protein
MSGNPCRGRGAAASLPVAAISVARGFGRLVQPAAPWLRISPQLPIHDLTDSGAGYRFTRLTNAFSKKLESHAHMVALYALWYNFVRISQDAADLAGDGSWDRDAAMVDGGRGSAN